MGILEYVDIDQLKVAAEKAARAAWDHILLPTAKKLVADTSTPWDDAALKLVTELVEAAIDSISPDA